jgi:hypothetical protein
MEKLLLIGTIVLVLTGSAYSAEYRCKTNCSSGQCYSRCAWFYTEQELYEQGQRNGERGLAYNSRGGTRRASPLACQNALESGVDPDVMRSYGCRN